MKHTWGFVGYHQPRRRLGSFDLGDRLGCSCFQAVIRTISYDTTWNLAYSREIKPLSPNDLSTSLFGNLPISFIRPTHGKDSHHPWTRRGLDRLLELGYSSWRFRLTCIYRMSVRFELGWIHLLQWQWTSRGLISVVVHTGCHPEKREVEERWRLTELLLDLHGRRLDGLVDIIVAQSDPVISSCLREYERTYIGTSDGLPILKLLGVD
jgi:hypothetical protein